MLHTAMTKSNTFSTHMQYQLTSSKRSVMLEGIADRQHVLSCIETRNKHYKYKNILIMCLLLAPLTSHVTHHVFQLQHPGHYRCNGDCDLPIFCITTGGGAQGRCRWQNWGRRWRRWPLELRQDQ